METVREVRTLSVQVSGLHRTLIITSMAVVYTYACACEGFGKVIIGSSQHRLLQWWLTGRAVVFFCYIVDEMCMGLCAIKCHLKKTFDSTWLCGSVNKMVQCSYMNRIIQLKPLHFFTLLGLCSRKIQKYIYKKGSDCMP